MLKQPQKNKINEQLVHSKTRFNSEIDGETLTQKLDNYYKKEIK